MGPGDRAVLLQCRWYDPTTGRFISEDPARDGINWYSYVGNNPLKWTDPTGLKKTKEEREAKRAENRERRQSNKRERQRNRETKRRVRANDLRSQGKDDKADRIDNRVDNRTVRRSMNRMEQHNENVRNGYSGGGPEGRSAIPDINRLQKAYSQSVFNDPEVNRKIHRTDPFGIYAINDGEIAAIITGDSNPYGSRIYIRHGDDSVTLSAHLDSIKDGLSVGDKVNGGSQIGVMGSSGTNNRHLHVSYFAPGVESYLPKNTSDPSDFIASGHRPANTIISNTIISNTYGSSKHHESVDKHEGIDYSGRKENLILGWKYLR